MRPRPTTPAEPPRRPLTAGQVDRVLALAVYACPSPWHEAHLRAENADAPRLSRLARRLRYLWHRLGRFCDNCHPGELL